MGRLTITARAASTSSTRSAALMPVDEAGQHVLAGSDYDQGFGWHCHVSPDGNDLSCIHQQRALIYVAFGDGEDLSSDDCQQGDLRTKPDFGC